MINTQCSIDHTNCKLPSWCPRIVSTTKARVMVEDVSTKYWKESRKRHNWRRKSEAMSFFIVISTVVFLEKKKNRNIRWALKGIAYQSYVGPFLDYTTRKRSWHQILLNYLSVSLLWHCREKRKLTFHVKTRIQAHFPILIRSKKLRRFKSDNHGIRAISIFLNSLRSSTPLVSTSALKIFSWAWVEIASVSKPSGDGVLFSILWYKTEMSGGSSKSRL